MEINTYTINASNHRGYVGNNALYPLKSFVDTIAL